MTKPLPIDFSQPAIGLNEDPILAIAQRFAALPTFDRAVDEYVIRAINFRRGPRLVNKLISYEKRWRVVAFLLYLALDHEEFGEAGGATYKRLADICATAPTISPRVLKTVLALLQVTGYVNTVRSELDRRSKTYQPTPMMFAFVAEWIDYAVHTLDILEPELKRAALVKSDADFTKRFLVKAGRARLKDKPLVDRMPGYVSFFGRKEGATALLLVVQHSQNTGEPIPSRSALAKRFSMSKTQVNAVFADAEQEGLIIFEGDAPRPTPMLFQAQRQWIAIELAFYARNMGPVYE